MIKLYYIILNEGFKEGSVPKIEIHHKGAPLLQDIKKHIAMATDEPLDTKIRQFSPEVIELQTSAGMAMSQTVVVRPRRVEGR